MERRQCRGCAAHLAYETSGNAVAFGADRLTRQLERPICAGFLALCVLFLLVVLLPGIWRGREQAFKEG